MMLNINQYLCKKKKNDKEHKLPLQHHYSAQEYPRLLERCLYSIPTWDEIQIIIIDDNSNSESVDFSHFPGNGRKNTEVLFTKEEKGQDTHGT